MASRTTSLDSESALFDLLIELGAREVSHSGRSLYEHLSGVYSILRAWEQPDDVCNAGMFHSIYSTEKFQHATLPISERRRLQATIGEESEYLVYLFAALPRAAIFDAAKSWSPLFLSDFAEIRCRWDGGMVIRVAATEMARLVVLHLANRIEQASKPATGIGFWLARMSELAGNMPAFSDTLPTALKDLGTNTVDDERHLHSLYLQGIGLLLGGDPAGALRHLEDACRIGELVAEPFLMLAVAHRLLGDSQAAQKAASKGRVLLRRWGTPWHKRLSMEGWCALADLITDEAPIEEIGNVLREISTANDQAQALAGEESNVSGSAIDAAQPDVSRFFSYLKGIQTHRSNRAIKWYPGLSRKAWYDAAQLQVARDLESRYEEIRAEALNVEPGHYYEEAENIGRVGSWQVCMFYEQGRRNDTVCRQCPTIASILDSHSGVRRSAGLIYLSKMAPHTHIAAHQARGNVRLRCHLAIRIPHGDCAIRVADEVRHWHEGKCMVFDDTYEHEVWNRTDEERLVLLVDLWHPDLTQLERDALDTINWLSMNNASGMAETWQRNDSQREREGKRAVSSIGDMFD